MVERCKHSNGISTKTVLFSASVNKSPSSFILNEQIPTNINLSNSITSTSSTSQLIKQTLSPLVHHRNIPQNTSNLLNDSKGTVNQFNTKQNTVSSSLGNYHFSSNTFITNNNNSNSKTNFSLASVDDTNTSIEKTSSPSRVLSNHTNTLPSNLGRSNNIQYQFESNYLLKNNTKSVASPGNSIFFNTLTSIPSSNVSSSQTSINAATTSSNVSNNSFSSNNTYSTLPKTTNSLNTSNVTSSIYGNVSAVANEFEQLIARNTCGNNSINSISNPSVYNHGSYNTLGSYRVQYSSTNPFLNNFNSNSSDFNVSTEQKAIDDK